MARGHIYSRTLRALSGYFSNWIMMDGATVTLPWDSREISAYPREHPDQELQNIGL